MARATLSEAPVLLVDEPTAHLDASAAASVHALLADLGRREERDLRIGDLAAFLARHLGPGGV